MSAKGFLLLQILLVVVLATHLIAANLAGAAPLVCIWLDVRQTRRGDDQAGALGRHLARQALVWLTVAIGLGAAALLLVWLTDWETFAATAGRLPASRYWWGIAELGVYYICVGGYLLMWKSPTASGHPAAPRPATWQVVTRRLLGVLASSNLLYHFPLLFTVIGVFAARPESDAGPLNFRSAIIDPEVFSQFLHHVLASFAVVGVAVMGYALRIGRQGAAADAVSRVATWGARIALLPTLAQLGVGVYVLVELPARARDALLGGDATASLLFAVSLFGAIALMHRLAAIAFGETERRNLIVAMALLLAVIAAMVGTLARSRHLSIAAVVHEDNRPSNRSEVIASNYVDVKLVALDMAEIG